jgi:hypothetical protein
MVCSPSHTAPKAVDYGQWTESGLDQASGRPVFRQAQDSEQSRTAKGAIDPTLIDSETLWQGCQRVFLYLDTEFGELLVM